MENENMTPERVKAIRAKFGDTVIGFAKRCGVSRITVHAWERGAAGFSSSSVRLLEILEEQANAFKLDAVR